MAHTVFLLVLGAMCSVAAAAYDTVLDPQDVAAAVAIGQSRIEDQARFHRPYRTAVNRPPVDSIEIVTPFRQVVMAAESQMRLGSRLFTQREGLALAAARGNQIDVILETTFHPLNAYVGVPPYEIVLVPATGAAVTPATIERVPRYPVGSVAGKEPGTGQPLAGGTVTASFDGTALNPARAYDVVIRESGKELARGRLDLGALR